MPYLIAMVDIDASRLEPFVTWGTSPGMVVPVTSYADPE